MHVFLGDGMQHTAGRAAFAPQLCTPRMLGLARCKRMGVGLTLHKNIIALAWIHLLKYESVVGCLLTHKPLTKVLQHRRGASQRNTPPGSADLLCCNKCKV